MKIKPARYIALAMALALALGGCAKSKVINGVEYQPYGMLNEDSRKSPKVHYEIPASNWVVGVLFSETFLIPGYIILFDPWEPTVPVAEVKQ